MTEQERGHRKKQYLLKKIESQEKRKGYSKFSKKKNKLPSVDYDLNLRDFIAQLSGYDTKVRKALVAMYQKKKKAITAINEMKDNGEKFNAKLTPLQRAEIIELFSRMFTLKEVYDIVTKEWGMTYSMTSLHKFRTTHFEIIKRRRNIYINDIGKLRLVHKRARIEELMNLYDITSETGDVKNGLAILDQIKTEVEKNQLEVVVSGEVNINEIHKINLDVGLENIKGLAFMRVLSKLPEQAMNRIKNELLLSKNIKLLDMSNTIKNAEFEEIKQELDEVGSDDDYNDEAPVSKPIKKDKGKEEEIPKREEPKLSKVKKDLLKRLRKQKERLIEVNNKVDKRETNKRGDI